MAGVPRLHSDKVNDEYALGEVSERSEKKRSPDGSPMCRLPSSDKIERVLPCGSTPAFPVLVLKLNGEEFLELLKTVLGPASRYPSRFERELLQLVGRKPSLGFRNWDMSREADRPLFLREHLVVAQDHRRRHKPHKFPFSRGVLNASRTGSQLKLRHQRRDAPSLDNLVSHLSNSR